MENSELQKLLSIIFSIIILSGPFSSAVASAVENANMETGTEPKYVDSVSSIQRLQGDDAVRNYSDSINSYVQPSANYQPPELNSAASSYPYPELGKFFNSSRNLTSNTQNLSLSLYTMLAAMNAMDMAINRTDSDILKFLKDPVIEPDYPVNASNASTCPTCGNSSNITQSNVTLSDFVRKFLNEWDGAETQFNNSSQRMDELNVSMVEAFNELPGLYSRIGVYDTVIDQHNAAFREYNKQYSNISPKIKNFNDSLSSVNDLVTIFKILDEIQLPYSTENMTNLNINLTVSRIFSRQLFFAKENVTINSKVGNFYPYNLTGLIILRDESSGIEKGYEYIFTPGIKVYSSNWTLNTLGLKNFTVSFYWYDEEVDRFRFFATANHEVLIERYYTEEDLLNIFNNSITAGRELRDLLDGATRIKDVYKTYDTLPHRRLNALNDSVQILPDYNFTTFNATPTLPSINFTSEIKDLASQMKNDPDNIYSYVRDAVKIEPYFGSSKGAQGTLDYLGGNSLDQAALTVAMLKAAGYPARIVYGVVEMNRSKVALWYDINETEVETLFRTVGTPYLAVGDNLRFEHAWVAAYIEDRWVQFDPSFKIVEREPIKTEEMLLGNDTYYVEWINETELLELNITEEMEKNVTIENPLVNYTNIPYSSPFKSIGVLGIYDDIPSALKHRVELILDNQTISFYIQDILSKRVSVSYDIDPVVDGFGGIEKIPAFLINSTPKIIIEDTITQRMSPKKLGDIQKFEIDVYSPHIGWQKITKSLIVGNTYSLTFDAGKMEYNAAYNEYLDYNHLKSIGADNETVTQQDLFAVGKLYFLIADEYYDSKADRYLLKYWRSVPGIVAVSKENSISKFAIPIQAVSAGVSTDVLQDIIITQTLPEQKNDIVKIVHVLETVTDMSMAEAMTLNLAGSTNTSVSTAMFFMNTINEGKREAIAPYIITHCNKNMLDILSLPSDVVFEIQKAVDAEKVVMVIPQLLRVHNYHGTAWYVYDPKTGASGAYIATSVSTNGGAGSSADFLLDPYETIRNFLRSIANAIRLLNSIKDLLIQLPSARNYIEASSTLNLIKEFVGSVNRILRPVGIAIDIMDLIMHIEGEDNSYFDKCGSIGWGVAVACDITFALTKIGLTIGCMYVVAGCSAIVGATAGAGFIACVAGALATCFVASLPSFSAWARTWVCGPEIEFDYNVQYDYETANAIIDVTEESNFFGKHALTNSNFEFKIYKNDGIFSDTYVNSGNYQPSLLEPGWMCPGMGSGGTNIPISVPPAKGKYYVNSKATGSWYAAGQSSFGGPTEDFEINLDYTTGLEVPESADQGQTISAKAWVRNEGEYDIDVAAVVSIAGENGYGTDSQSATIHPGETLIAQTSYTTKTYPCGSGEAEHIYSFATYHVRAGVDTETEDKDSHIVTYKKPCPRADDNKDPYPYGSTSKDFSSAGLYYESANIKSFYSQNDFNGQEINLTAFYQRSVKIAVLEEGYFYDMKELLDHVGAVYDGISYENLLNRSINDLMKYKAIVLPSGALLGRSGDKALENRLDEYVKNGGRIIVFAQARDEEYTILPGDLEGYGWINSVMCILDSSYITKYDPILASQVGDIYDINLDGTFNKVPEGSNIILKRSEGGGAQAGLPVAVVYDHGKGQVFATTAYPDQAFDMGIMTQDTLLVMRDIINWAESEGTIAVYKPASTLSSNMTITNYDDYGVSNVFIHVVDPMGKVARNEVVNISMEAHETKNISYSWDIPENARKGIWKLQYSFRGWDRFTDEWFAVTNITVMSVLNSKLNKQVYNLSEGGVFSIDLYNPLFDAAGTMALHITNSTKTELWNTTVPISVNKDETKTYNIDFPVPGNLLTGDYSLNYSIFDSGNVRIGAGTHIFKVNGLSGRVNIDPEFNEYKVRDKARVNVELLDTSDYNITDANGIFTIYLPNGSISKVTDKISVNAGGTWNKTYEFVIDPFIPSKIDGFYEYKVYYEVSNNDLRIAHDSSSFIVPNVRISEPDVVFDKSEYVIGDTGNAVISFENVGGVDLHGGIIAYQLTASDFNKSDIVSIPVLQPGQEHSEIISFNVPEIPDSDLKLEYWICAFNNCGNKNTLSNGIKKSRIKGYSAQVNISLYTQTVREGDVLTGIINVKNTGTANITGTLNVATEGADLSIIGQNTINLTIGKSEAIDINLTQSIPTDIGGGIGSVRAEYLHDTSVLDSGTKSFNIDVTGLNIIIQKEKEIYFNNESASFKVILDNKLGIDLTSATVEFKSQYFEDVRTVNIPQNGNTYEFFNFSIPDNAAEGEKRIDVNLYSNNGVLKGTSAARFKVPNIDLRITGSLNKQLFDREDTLRLNYSITNVGDIDLNDMMVRVYSPNIISSDTVANINLTSDHTGFLEFIIPSSIANGRHFVYIEISKYGKIFTKSEYTFYIPGPGAQILNPGILSSYIANNTYPMTFTIQNNGIPSLNDTEVELSISSIFRESKKINLEPDEIKNVTFNVSFPPDLVTMPMTVDLKVKKDAAVLATYHDFFLLKGMEGGVFDITRDKPFYLPGDNATLTFTVGNLGWVDIYNAKLLVKLNGVFNQTFTNIDIPRNTMENHTVTFTLPFSIASGEKKISYELVSPTGIDLELGNEYIQVLGPDDWVGISTHKNIYRPNDAVHAFATVRNLGNTTLSGNLSIDVPDIYHENIPIDLAPFSETGIVNIDFRLPLELRSDRYPINYALYNNGSIIYSGVSYFRVNGISASIILIDTDRISYALAETPEFEVNILNSGSIYIDGFINSDLYDPTGRKVDSNRKNISIPPLEIYSPRIGLNIPLDGKEGMYKAQFNIVTRSGINVTNDFSTIDVFKPVLYIPKRTIQENTIKNSLLRSSIFITNLGNAPILDVTLTPQGQIKDWLAFESDHFTIGGNEIKTLPFNIRTPDVDPGMYNGSILVSYGNSNISMDIFIKVGGLDISPDPLFFTANPGERNSFNVNIRNSGNRIDNITLTSTLDPVFSDNVFALQQNEEKTVSLLADIPADKAPRNYSYTLRVDSTDGSGTFDLVLNVLKEPKIITPGSLEFNSLPGLETEYSFEISNIGNSEKSITINTTGLTMLEIIPKNLIIMPKLTSTVKVRVNATAPGNFSGQILVEDKSIPTTVHVYDIAIDPKIIEKTVTAGKSEELTLTISNNVSDIKNIHLGNVNWLTYSENDFGVQKGQTKLISVNISVPQYQVAQIYASTLYLSSELFNGQIPVIIKIPPTSSFELSKNNISSPMIRNLEFHDFMTIINNGNIVSTITLAKTGIISNWLQTWINQQSNVFELTENNSLELGVPGQSYKAKNADIEVLVDVPSSQQPGTYTGSLVFSSDGISRETGIISMVTNLTVYPDSSAFTLNEGEQTNESMMLHNSGLNSIDINLTIFDRSFEFTRLSSNLIKPGYFRFNPNPVHLNSSETMNFNYTVEIPEGQSPGEYKGHIYLNTTDGVGYEPVIITVPARSQISVAPKTIDTVINAGRNESMTITVYNTGNIGTYVDYSAGGNISGFVSFSTTRQLIKAQSSGSVTLLMSIPEGTSGQFTGELFVSSGNELIRIPVTISVYSVVIKPKNIDTIVQDGMNQTFNISIYNDLNESITISPAKTGQIKDWIDMSIANGTVIASRETLYKNITVNVPPLTSDGVYTGTVSLGINTNSNSFADSINFRITVSQTPEIEMSGINKTVLAGFLDRFAISLQNSGNSGTYVNLSTSGDIQDVVSFDPNRVWVGKGSTISAEGTINVPFNQTSGNFTVTVTGSYNGKTSGSIIGIHIPDIRILPENLNYSVEDGASGTFNITIINNETDISGASLHVERQSGTPEPWVGFNETFFNIPQNITKVVTMMISVPAGTQPITNTDRLKFISGFSNAREMKITVPVSQRILLSPPLITKKFFRDIRGQGSVNVINDGNVPLNDIVLTMSGDAAPITIIDDNYIDIPAKSTRTAQMHFETTNPGVFNGTLNADVNGMNKSAAISIEVVDAYVSPKSYSDTITDGSSKEYNLTVFNNLSSPIDIGIYRSGVIKSWITIPDNLSVASGSSSKLNFTISVPAAKPGGVYTGEILMNADGGGNMSIPLSVIVPENKLITVVPSEISFSTRVNITNKVYVNITNNGNTKIQNAALKSFTANISGMVTDKRSGFPVMPRTSELAYISILAGNGTADGWYNGSFVVDADGILNTVRLNIEVDTTPPASITNLQNTTFAQNYINWTWTDPADADFANVSIWINAVFKANISKGTQFYNATGFAPNSEHTISTRTVDTIGNINQTWVNHTARTRSSTTANFDNWQYYRNITINNSGSALTDYQILLNLTGAAFPFRANASGADLRFEQGGTELSYWIEKWDYANASALVWVKVMDVPAGGSVVRMWYGNEKAMGVSDGNAVFEFFDDFEGAGLDASKWIGDIDRTSVNNSVMTFTIASGAASINTIDISGDVAVRAHNKITVGWPSTGMFGFGKPDFSLRAYQEIAMSGSELYMTTNDGITRHQINTDWTHNAWKTIDIKIEKGARISWSENDVGRVNSPSIIDIPDGDMPIFIYTSNGAYVYVDWVLVRKYASYDPSVIIGAEHSKGLSKSGGGTWQYYRNITINNTGSATLSDYQILVNLTGAAFPLRANSSGADLRFEQSGAELNYWIEKWDHANASALVWVKAAGVPAGESIVRMWYGNPKATEISDVTATFKRIIDGGQPVVGSWNFDDGSGTKTHDSSGKGNDGVLVNSPIWVDGNYGKALSFDGMNDYVDTADIDLPLTFTLYAWIKPNNLTGVQNIISKELSSYYFQFDFNGKLVGSVKNSGGSYTQYRTNNIVLNHSQWQQVAMLYNGNGGANEKMKFYVNGANYAAAFIGGYDAGGIPADVSTTVKIGIDGDGTSIPFNGSIDEVHIYNRALSASEISDLYNNYGYTTTNYPGRVLVRKYASPEPSVIVSAEHSKGLSNSGGGTWQYSRNITINNTGAALTDYQILLNLTGAAFPLRANASGADLRFEQGGAELSYWFEKWDYANSSALVWVNVTSVPAGENRIKFWFGNPNATDVSNVNSTFIRIIDGNRLSLSMDEGAGTTVYDKSGNGNNGAIYGATFVDDIHGKALSFDGVNDYFTVSKSPSISPLLNGTVEFWFKLANNATVNDGQFFFLISIPGTGAPITRGVWNIVIEAQTLTGDLSEYSGKLVTALSDGTSWHYLGSIQTSWHSNEWNHVLWRFGSDGQTLYINGVNSSSDSYTGEASFADYNDMIFGKDIRAGQWGSAQYFNGTIDEVRIYNRALSVSEISDLYNNCGYTTTKYPGRVLVRKYASPEPIVSGIGEEQVLASTDSSGSAVGMQTLNVKAPPFIRSVDTKPSKPVSGDTTSISAEEVKVDNNDLIDVNFTSKALDELEIERFYHAQNDTITFSIDSGSKFAVFGFTTSQIHITKDGTEITDRVNHTTGFNETDSTYYAKFFEESHNSTFTVYDPLDVTEPVSRGLNWTARTNNSDGSFGFGIDERDSASAVYALNISGKYNLSREIGALDIFEPVSERYGFEAAFYENAVRKDSRIIDRILNTQSTDGSWNSNVEDTGFALLTLKASGNNTQAVINAENSGLFWLKSVQNMDGGFAYGGGSSYPLYTAVAAMALKEYGATSEYNAAALWLLDHMYPDGSWKYTRDTAYSVTALADSGYDLSKPVLFLKDNSGKDPYERAISIRALSTAGLNTDSMLEELYADRTPVTATWGSMTLEDRIITTSSAMMLFNITGYRDDQNKAAGFLQNASAPTLHSILYMAAALHNDSILAEIISYKNPDGGFGELYHESNVWDSSMAYMALYNSSYTPEKDAAAAYIAGKQEVSGAFGTVEETSMAIIALFMSGNASYSASIDQGLEYLISKQDADGSWNRNNYRTALALEALVTASKGRYEANITKSAAYLVFVQNNSGNWMWEYPDTLTTINVLRSLIWISEDTTPPQSITNPSLQATGTTWLNFTWLNPPDPDFSHVMLYLNGAFLKNITVPQNFANITGLSPDTLYELGTHTVDTLGNINQTWVNATARTAPADSNPPVADCGSDKLKCENIASPISFNGSASYDPDGAIVSYYWDFGDGTNGPGVAPTHKYSTYRWNGTAYIPFTVNLTITDNDGLTNSTSQKVVIWIAGDANGDGKVNILDASLVGLKWNSNPSDPCADLNNDGKVNILDASIIGLNWGKSA